jgi:hypothetical protein
LHRSLWTGVDQDNVDLDPCPIGVAASDIERECAQMFTAFRRSCVSEQA